MRGFLTAAEKIEHFSISLQRLGSQSADEVYER